MKLIPDATHRHAILAIDVAGGEQVTLWLQKQEYNRWWSFVRRLRKKEAVKPPEKPGAA